MVQQQNYHPSHKHTPSSFLQPDSVCSFFFLVALIYLLLLQFISIIFLLSYFIFLNFISLSKHDISPQTLPRKREGKKQAPVYQIEPNHIPKSYLPFTFISKYLFFGLHSILHYIGQLLWSFTDKQLGSL